MYDFDWHRRHAEQTRRGAEHILGLIRSFNAFESVLDVGCGSGLWLDVARTLGCSSVCGIDGPWTDRNALHIAKSDFSVVDLAEHFDLARRFDLAISLEVAEHVDPKASDMFVRNLTAHADLVVFGAAIPYQGGFRHINERWQSFWRGKFEASGYDCFDLVRPMIWDEPDVHYWYKQNILVYVRRERTDLVEAIRNVMAERNISGFPTDLVHPEKYDAIASYNQIAFRPLLRRLPSQMGAKLKTLALLKA